MIHGCPPFIYYFFSFVFHYKRLHKFSWTTVYVHIILTFVTTRLIPYLLEISGITRDLPIDHLKYHCKRLQILLNKILIQKSLFIAKITIITSFWGVKNQTRSELYFVIQKKIYNTCNSTFFSRIDNMKQQKNLQISQRAVLI